MNLASGVAATRLFAAGSNHSLAVGSDGQIYQWGQHKGSFVPPTTAPEPISLPEGARTIVIVDAGHDHSAALDHHGNLYTWGQNEYGQLGTGTTEPEVLPVIVKLPN